MEAILKKSGIYILINVINNKFYIGSAIELSRRKYSHFSRLKTQVHANKYLQNSYNKYGKKAFKFEVLEVVEDRTKLVEREQHYIDCLKPHYNLRVVAWSNLGYKHSKEECLAKSIRQTGSKRSKFAGLNISKAKLIKNSNKPVKLWALRRINSGKPILQYDFENNFIKEWSGATEAAIFLGLRSTSGIVACCKNKRRGSAGYQWKYKNKA